MWNDISLTYFFSVKSMKKKETIAKYSGSIFYYEQFTKATVIVI